MYALIRKWESGNLTQQQFFNESGICKSTFGYWRKKYLKEFGKEGKKDKFIPVKVTCPDHGDPNVSAIELVYPNGVRMVCSSDMDPHARIYNPCKK